MPTVEASDGDFLANYTIKVKQKFNSQTQQNLSANTTDTLAQAFIKMQAYANNTHTFHV